MGHESFDRYDEYANGSYFVWGRWPVMCASSMGKACVATLHLPAFCGDGSWYLLSSTSLTLSGTTLTRKQSRCASAMRVFVFVCVCVFVYVCVCVCEGNNPSGEEGGRNGQDGD